MTRPNPLHGVAIVGLHNTRQARALPDETSRSLTISAAVAAVDDEALAITDVDGVTGADPAELIYDLQLGPAWQGHAGIGIPVVLEAALAIASGQCDVAVVAAADAGVYTDRAATAPWTRPANEFVAPWGLFTAAEFALVARRHMEVYGTTSEQLATVAATIRNNGHVNPDAVYYERGPFTPEDILASRMVADPFHLLDCATTSEGGCALVLTSAARARNLPRKPVYLLGGAHDSFGPAYCYPPAFDLGRDAELVNGPGRRAADLSFAMAGLERDDVDVLELYDPFSFEIIRQLEAYRFCGIGEGGPFVEAGNIAPDGRFPVTTDGGTMSYSHPGNLPQMFQRITRAAEQLRGECKSRQVADARVALCSNGGAGALFTSVMILGTEVP